MAFFTLSIASKSKQTHRLVSSPGCANRLTDQWPITMSTHKPEKKPNGLDLQFDQMLLKNFQVSVISRGTRPLVAISCESEMWMYGCWEMEEKW